MSDVNNFKPKVYKATAGWPVEKTEPQSKGIVIPEDPIQIDLKKYGQNIDLICEKLDIIIKLLKCLASEKETKKKTKPKT